MSRLFTAETTLRAAKSIQEKAFANPKIEFMWDSVVAELKGEDILTSMVVKNVKTGETREIVADEEDGTFGVFVFIGYDPQSKVFEGKLNMDRGCIITDENMHTNIPGVFAAGRYPRQKPAAGGDRRGRRRNCGCRMRKVPGVID